MVLKRQELGTDCAHGYWSSTASGPLCWQSYEMYGFKYTSNIQINTFTSVLLYLPEFTLKCSALAHCNRVYSRFLPCHICKSLLWKYGPQYTTLIYMVNFSFMWLIFLCRYPLSCADAFLPSPGSDSTYHPRLPCRLPHPSWPDHPPMDCPAFLTQLRCWLSMLCSSLHLFHFTEPLTPLASHLPLTTFLILFRLGHCSGPLQTPFPPRCGLFLQEKKKKCLCTNLKEIDSFLRPLH